MFIHNGMFFSADILANAKILHKQRLLTVTALMEQQDSRAGLCYSIQYFDTKKIESTYSLLSQESTT